MKKFSDRDRAGAFGDSKVVVLASRRRPWRRPSISPANIRLSIATLVLVMVGAFLVSTYVPTATGETPPVGFSAGPIPICSGWGPRRTCLVDGDTGWENSVKWRLRDVDTPEISAPRCPDELRQGLAARDRLQELMRHGYRIDSSGSTDRYGRQLVSITLPDASDAARVLLGDGYAQPGPKAQRNWCG